MQVSHARHDAHDHSRTGRSRPDLARHHAASGRTCRPARPAPPAHPGAARRRGARRQTGQAARQAVVPLALSSRRHRFCRHDRYGQDHAPLAGRPLRHRPPRDRRGAAFERRHAQMAAPHKRRARVRDGLHPRCRPRDAVRLEPDRLHAQLHLLPHRDDAAGAQSDPGRNRRPGDARARFAGRMAERQNGFRRG